MPLKTLRITFTEAEIAEILIASAIEIAGPGWAGQFGTATANITYSDGKPATTSALTVQLTPRSVGDGEEGGDRD